MTKPIRISVLLSDGYGGYGGIALYNRDVLKALCQHENIDTVLALPRKISHDMQKLPDNLIYETDAANGAFAYVKSIIRNIGFIGQSDIIYCAHINLVPFAWVLGKIARVPVILAIYGIDAWQPTGRFFTDLLARRVSIYLSISKYTKDRFLQWAQVNPSLVKLMPNAIDLDKFGTGEKSPSILKRYGIQDKTVLFSLGRIVSKERAKGFDEVIELLPALKKEIPNIAYVIAGDGDYADTLKEKAKRLGVDDRVVFTGFISEEEKPDLYRTADVFVMPSRGEGFGFVFLEAMACGVPVIASSVDGSRDAVKDGELGMMVDPADSDSLYAAILHSLKKSREIPEGITYFSISIFSKRLNKIIDEVLATGGAEQ